MSRDRVKKSLSEEVDELNKLRSEVEEEKQRKIRLDTKIANLEKTVETLSAAFENEANDEESQTWKAKYDMQANLNTKLDEEMKSLNQRLAEALQLLDEKDRLIRAPKQTDPLSDETEIRPYDIKLLERERIILQGEIRNVEHRLDQEAQAFHKAVEKRKRIENDVGISRRHLLQHPIMIKTKPPPPPPLHAPPASDAHSHHQQQQQVHHQQMYNEQRPWQTTVHTPKKQTTSTYQNSSVPSSSLTVGSNHWRMHRNGATNGQLSGPHR